MFSTRLLPLVADPELVEGTGEDCGREPFGSELRTELLSRTVRVGVPEPIG